jgi:hypothetical protein
LRNSEWVVYSKRPFGGPEAVLAYLSRYTHRGAIANSRLIALDDASVTFRWKDYRAKGRERLKLMTLAVDEFIRRFLIHVLPGGFHRIRHYGLFANAGRADNIARAWQLLDASTPPPATPDPDSTADSGPQISPYPCPCCGGLSCRSRNSDRHLMIDGARSRPVTTRNRRSDGDVAARPLHLARRRILPSIRALTLRLSLPTASAFHANAADYRHRDTTSAPIDDAPASNTHRSCARHRRT